MEYFAHSANKHGEWECLEKHLQKTADLAQCFADAFGEGNAGEWLGLFHDAGKASALFQEVLKGREHRVNHWAAGAVLLEKNTLLSRVVYAHHKGIVWNIRDDLDASKKSAGSYDSQGNRRFSVSGPDEYKLTAQFMRTKLQIPGTQPALIHNGSSYYKNLPEMLHARMLLSCLADADYLATASHEDESILQNAQEISLDAEKILKELTAYRKKLTADSKADPCINSVRKKVYEDCLRSAEQPSGLFTLTAPTGTGKTLALLAFAAKHALMHGKRRIIVVLPFLSIITQNAAIYRRLCENVLESHSMVSYGDEKDVKLLSERWNAPVVVTTSVKFFEAFFKSKPSDLRFLHSIANSVIVFDEAQSVPPDLMGTTIETMRMLCEMFNCTVLFSTATQPAFDMRRDIQFCPYEVISDPVSLYAQTRRISVKWNVETKTPLESIAEMMASHDSACCVLNRKDHVRKLFSMMTERCPQDECYHISTDMCTAHRNSVIAEIMHRLNNNLPCRLVSTSCIEAGVDLDFTYMYRALAPLEAIIQCAGRCNRNGRGSGIMTVFVPDEEKLYPATFYANAAEKVKLLLTRHPIDICSVEHIREYYSILLADANYNHDDALLQKAIENHDFEMAQKHYRFIPQSGVNVLVPYAGCIKLFRALAAEAREKGISADWMRRAAPLTVSCYYEDKLKGVAERCQIYTKRGKQEVPGWYILLADDCYDKTTGLHFTDESSLDYLI